MTRADAEALVYKGHAEWISSYEIRTRAGVVFRFLGPGIPVIG